LSKIKRAHPAVPPDNPEEIIGLDIGSARIGIARGSGVAKIAEALKTVPAGNAIEEIKKLNPDIIVVGLPRSLDGNETDQTAYVRDWVRSAVKQIDKPFYWQDEALTTQAAAASSDLAGDDAAAAAVILQDFLDTPKDRRVRC
jgi:putative Holliday junction resolvase